MELIDLKKLLIRKQKYEEEKKREKEKSKELYRLIKAGDVLYPRIVGLQAALKNYNEMK